MYTGACTHTYTKMIINALYNSSNYKGDTLGMVFQYITNRTELNVPLPPLVAHVATPDGTHQESMCN